MFTKLKEIKKDHPLLRIVVGMDANHFLDKTNFMNEKQNPVFFMTPEVPEKPTTIKQRSFMQAQFKKAGIAVSEVKDHIVTTSKII